MSLFGDLDVASAEDNPWAVPANTYEMDLFKVEVKDKDGKKGLILTYKISAGEHKDKTVSEYKAIPQPADPKNPTKEESDALSYLKMRLKSLGVPESRMNTVDINDLQGTACIVTVAINGEYTNVKKVELAGDTAAPAQSFTGFGG